MNREQKKAQTHGRIKEAAIALFDEQGYETTTVQQVADRAEVAKGTFFNYFSSKESLILELQGEMMLREMESTVGKPGPVMPRMLALLYDHARSFMMNRSVTCAVLQGMFTSDRMRLAQDERCAEMVNTLKPVFLYAQEKGEVRTDLSADILAQLAVQTYHGVLMSWATGQGEEQLTDQMALTFEVFTQGIRP